MVWSAQESWKRPLSPIAKPALSSPPLNQVPNATSTHLLKIFKDGGSQGIKCRSRAELSVSVLSEMAEVLTSKSYYQSELKHKMLAQPQVAFQ